MKKSIGLLVSLAVAGVAGAYYYSQMASKEAGAGLLLYGNVEVTEVDTGFKTPGRIEEILADEGSSVKKGDVMARLENVETESAVAQAEAALNEAQERLKEISLGSRKQEIAQASAVVEQAKAELDRAEKELKRAVFLQSNGAIPTQKLEDAQKVRDVAWNLHKKATEAFSLAVEGPRKESIAAAHARVQQLEAALSIAQERLNDTTLVSPVEGIVLRKNMEPGETAGAGSPVFTIGDLKNPWVRVYVKEDRLNSVKIGQKAAVMVDAYPGKVFEGTISYIASEAEFTPKNIQTKEERVKLVFAVKVAVKNDGMELKPGMPADVRLDAGDRG
jgi:HlyD family secretion protein